jgi:hypothetical protein
LIIAHGWPSDVMYRIAPFPSTTVTGSVRLRVLACFCVSSLSCVRVCGVLRFVLVWRASRIEGVWNRGGCSTVRARMTGGSAIREEPSTLQDISHPRGFRGTCYSRSPFPLIGAYDLSQYEALLPKIVDLRAERCSSPSICDTERYASRPCNSRIGGGVLEMEGARNRGRF